LIRSHAYRKRTGRPERRVPWYILMTKQSNRMNIRLNFLSLLNLVLLFGQTGNAAAQGFISGDVRGRFLFDIGPTVNRVEGIPLFIGAAIESTNDRPFYVEGRAIVRIEDGIPAELDRVGFRARAEKALANERAFNIGVAGWSEVSPIEERGLANLEASLSTLLFRDDRRDYYESIGLAVYARVSPQDGPYRGILQYHFERIQPMNVGAASSLFRNNRPWRLQPLANEGDLHSIVAIVEFDTRVTGDDGPFNGWFTSLETRLGISGSLEAIPANDETGAPVQNIPDPNNKPLTGRVDLRRYNAIGDLAINLRATAAGTLTDETLPFHMQHAIGGAGSLPGYDLFALDCGARTEDTFVTPARATLAAGFYQYYGCDRFVLAQAEIIGYFGFRIAPGEDRSVWDGPSGTRINLVPRWVLFANAGRAWSMLDPDVTFATDHDWVYDVGGGVRFGDLGAYAAYPLNGVDKTVKGIVRLTRRF